MKGGKDYSELLERIVGAAADMRLTQRIYFAERSKSNLISAKEAERKLDRLLAELELARREPPAPIVQEVLIDVESGLPI